MAVALKNAYVKQNIHDAMDVYIWRDNRGYVQTDIYVFQQAGWTVYGISYSSGWIYYKKPFS